MKRIFILIFLLLFECSGCAWFEIREEKSAQELASSGINEFKNSNYRKAIELFEKLRDWYPFSKYAILAELKIADAHYYLKEYEEAISAYGEFESLHPRNEAIPYIIYQIGLCYFEQLDTVDRDQTCAKKGLDAFNRLTGQFPDDTYAKKAGEYKKKCHDSLAGHEFYVGLFYYKNKHYKAAMQRFKTVLSKYPDVGIHQEALRYIAMCEASLTQEYLK